VRLWSANPQGTLRLYLDGSEAPALEAPMGELLDGHVAPFLAPLGHEAAKGHSLYFPFPYARHCKVTVDQPERLYYHVDYRVYAAGTRVEPFSLDEARALAPEIARVARALAAPETPRGATRTLELSSAPSLISGGGVVRELQVQPPAPADAELVLRFDGKETVRVPLRAFFGGAVPYRSLPFTVAADGTLSCRWPMPFRSRAELLITTGAARARITVGPWLFGDDSYYFHARWHAPEDLPTAQPRDWNVITIDGDGAGAYVGNALDVDYFAHSWWGEGDEKIYVDGEPFPSWFGTGTEDYYGYAWCSTRKFAHAYHAQTRADGPDRPAWNADGFGHTSVNRWHVLDPIVFSKRFQFDLEILDWHHDSHVVVSAVDYYYARQ
jgi:hypothetical protein